VIRPAILTVEARDDLRAELRWIGPENIPRAQALREAIAAAARHLGDRPLLGRRELDLLPDPYRFWSMTRFQVVLVYNAATMPPQILRILSTAQDLGPLLATIAAPLSGTPN
jgi:plasmid stabilization system protein ParE